LKIEFKENEPERENLIKEFEDLKFETVVSRGNQIRIANSHRDDSDTISPSCHFPVPFYTRHRQ